MQIRNIGKMWRVMEGEKTLAFATTYKMAQHRLRELIAHGIEYHTPRKEG